MKKVYVNKAGRMHKGEKPDGMSDGEYAKMMAKKGYKAMSPEAYENMSKSGHGSAEPDPGNKPSNAGDPSGEIAKGEGEEVDVSALSKALSQLAELVEHANPEQRREALLQKSLEGEISEEENAELLSILSGQAGGDAPEPLAKSVLAGLDPSSDEALEAGIDASEYIKAHHEGTVQAVTELANIVEKSQASTGQFHVVFAKALTAVGRELERLSKSIDGWGEQPLSQRPRSAQTPAQAQAKVLGKSFAGGAPEGEKFSRDDVLNVLEHMHQESIAKGMGGKSTSGEDLMGAITKYEQFNKMSKSLAGEVVAKARQMRAQAAA